MGANVFLCTSVMCLLFLTVSCSYSNDYRLFNKMADNLRRYQAKDVFPHKKTFLDTILSKFLQKSLVDAKKSALGRSLEDEVAEEEADKASALIRYVGIGYNFLEGCPDGDFDRGGIDPGIKSTRVIFDFTYNEKREEFYRDITVQVPDQVNFKPFSSCSGQSETSAYSGAKSYQRSLSRGLSFGVSLPGVEFGLSGSLKRAREKTANQKNVHLLQKIVCNFGEVRYLEEVRGIHKVSRSFYETVNSLPKEYDKDAYLGFLDDWGTHVIVGADVGKKNITRSTYMYSQVYKQLRKEKSGGIKIGGNYQGWGGSLGLDIGKMKGNAKNDANGALGTSVITMGSEKNPIPIRLTLKNITEALDPNYWNALPERGVTYESLSIAQKRSNIQRALEDYADYKEVQIIGDDPKVMVNVTWPDGRYALPGTTGDCPKSWKTGFRTQGVGENVDSSSYIVSRLGVKFGRKTIKQKYCTKMNDFPLEDENNEVAIKWPEGEYCIARKSDVCPSDFNEGSITWNDYKTTIFRESKNDVWGNLPDGTYDKNTEIFYCCRSDGKPTDPVILPLVDPFVLYRYGGKCQEVQGAKVQSDFIEYDDNSRAFSKNKCTGWHPDDDDCEDFHELYFCYYSREEPNDEYY